jgi:hypothetical protein
MRTMTAIAALSIGLVVPAAAQDVPETDIVFTAPEIEVEGYEIVDVDTDEMIIEALEDEAVYSSITNERIGEVDEVYTDTAAGETYIGMEIGGWLDIGDKDIAVPMDQVTIYRGEDYRVYVDATEEQIEDYPEYDLDDSIDFN